MRRVAWGPGGGPVGARIIDASLLTSSEHVDMTHHDSLEIMRRFPEIGVPLNHPS